MRRVLRLVDRLFGLVLGLFKHLFDHIPHVADLLLGLASAPVSLAFRFEVLIADDDSNNFSSWLFT